ncbi:HdlA2: heterodisulfide reductase-like protein, iron-sulfur subunit [Desulfobacula toluolica Tol2]|uniref:HdlA2: heterodisulfide reductase-like protein, iron-sulfur subunit n=1 Tax=Desulfobacula toluolica (strain DSM 7467 / Tol2) TaxID=651182 RepID=K0NHI1_DESTT|nr:FAD-dependent oxidoreductase [Desulfobacula toluolica]CCK79323.1 HdlA2: heterodisulfide reductase-like protein, iron-sulfur subunit [Desulfobacula toluolica Tol2]
MSIKKAPRYVDMDKCIACGECTKKCPGKTPDEFNEGLDKRKAIYVPYPQAVPLKYVIDPSKCLKILKDKCGTCAKVCPAGAINYDDKEENLTLSVGSVIMAAGFKPFDPSGLDNYQYSKFPNVVTSIEFERILSAGGPTHGHIECYPDKTEPKKIAWLQCVGSRDQNKCDNKYCSSVCCMYAVKEAMMAKDHIHGEFEASIFLMDMRTYGKDFEKYYERAKDDGVRFVRSRIHTITEDKNNGLVCTYVTEDGKNIEETFDMMVLSVGMETPHDLVQTVKDMGIELNANNFVVTSGFSPVETSRKGFYVCGALQEPKDIPLAVMEASAAACDAGTSLSPSRGSLTRTKEYPAEVDVISEDPRVGVFVCNCGTNIGGIVDVPAVAEYARTLPNVAFVEENMFTCSQDTQDKMKKVIEENHLNRIVVAACTPRTHEALFQETLKDSGLNKYLVEMANIRNQCSWVHSKEPELATAKSKDLVRIAVAKATLMRPLPQPSVGVVQKGLVIGGGVAGITAALGLARQGFFTTLVEKNDVLGGNALSLNHTWNGESITQNVRALISEVQEHPMIDVFTGTSVSATSGFIGNFSTTIATGEQEQVIEHGAIIVATGAKERKPTEYLYGEDDRVLTHLELDRKIATDDAFVKNMDTAVFIQCVGSREPERPYCSKVCCTHSVKSALAFKELNPDMEVYIIYRDIRTYGQREELYKEARDKGVIFIRYSHDKKPVVKTQDNEVLVRVKDHVLDLDLEISTDLVVLASAIVPEDNSALAQMFKLSLNDDNFFMEAHAKLRPVDFATDGIFLAGMAHYPKPIEESISQAKAAVSRATVVLSKETVTVDGVVSQVNEALCRGCCACEEACAFGAITVNEQENGVKIATVQQALCKGCGGCAAACPTGAASVFHYDNEVLAMVETALEQ